MDAATLSHVAAVLTFAVSMSVTPGPNNIMVAASGATFGYRRTIPHMLGISVGFPVMLAAVGVGLGTVFAARPLAHEVLRYVGIGYMLFLAWKIARARPPEADAAGATGATGGESASRPISFLQAALFQWVNAKAWIIAVGAVASFSRAGVALWQDLALLVGVFAVVCYGANTLWTLMGMMAGRLLTDPRALRAFNVTMAALLVLSILAVL